MVLSWTDDKEKDPENCERCGAALKVLESETDTDAEGPNRNPTMSRQDIEAQVLAALGCTKMIWLPHGLAADEDTNGHILISLSRDAWY